MGSVKDFNFLNSSVWLKYTQEKYVAIDDIKHKLKSLSIPQKDWPDIKSQIERLRKIAAVPLFINAIDKKFWYFPSDSINKKLHEVESRGNKIYDKIENHSPFKNEFLENVAIEESITSAIYEGANSTRAKARQLIVTQKSPTNTDEQMLVNKHEAMQWIKKNHNLGLSKSIVLNIHQIITKNTLEEKDSEFSGKFRNSKIFVSSSTGAVLHEGIAHKKIEEGLNEVIGLVTAPSRYLHHLIKGILLHYFIAYIHPFFDGNGRTARTLFYFESIKNNLNFIELLSISADLKEHGRQYERSFEMAVKYNLDITYFIDFCLDSLLTALNKVEKKVDFLLKISELKQSLNLNDSQILLLQKMALNKFIVISIEGYAMQIKKSREHSRASLKDLVEKDLLKEEKQGKKLVYRVDSKNLKKCIALKPNRV